MIPLLLMIGCGDGPTPPPSAICDAALLTDTLAMAGEGAQVRIGSCRIQGDFTVPAGVALTGTGPSSVIAGNDVAISGSTAQLENLTVEAGARAGVLLHGPGSASLVQVRIEAQSGVAFGAENLSMLALTEVSVQGPIDASNEDQISYPPDRRQTATHGIVAVQIADLELTGVTSNGFAGAGILLIESSARWERGNADANLGLGLHVQGGSAELIDVTLAQTFRGTWGIQTYGGAFTASAAIDSTNLTVDDNWYGLLHDGGSARHLGLSANGNQNAGVWAQFTSSFELAGTVRDNDFAGVVAFGAHGVSIHDSTIEQTHEVLRPDGEVGTITVGDGIQLIESADGARLLNLELVDNERVGLLIELRGGTFNAMEISDVTITQSAGNGAVCQHGSAPNDWDDGIARNGVTQAADRAVTDLAFPAVVGPCGRPVQISNLSALGI